MGEHEKMPSYMTQLLEELGWNQGTRIPLTNTGNQSLETLLINRQNEIQQLKEELQSQNEKRNDLNKYKEYVHSEYQENTRLLLAHKQQMEQEVKLRQLSLNTTKRLERDVIDSSKQSRDISERADRLQSNIARLLKRADSLKGEVCGERGALQEWRAALERKAGDITAIEQFTKQDLSRAKALETKRQKLKVEHDRVHERLSQLVANLTAEERACERISVQVMEGMEQRKQMMAMWAGAIENLRQRDTDIRHIREDYAVLQTELQKLAEQCREQQVFYEQQKGNNNDAESENLGLCQKLSQTRIAYQQMGEQNAFYDSEEKSLQREMHNVRSILENLHMENKTIMEDQYRKDQAIKVVTIKIRELKEKVIESQDKSKSSEKRAKELEDILNEEERYASQLTAQQQRAMHCSFVEQQKLLALKNEEKLCNMQLKSTKAVMAKLENKHRQLEKNLQLQKESLYNICFQLETVGARVLQIEGAQAEAECSAEVMARENRLKEVCARHAARVALLERHSVKLHDDMRRLTKEIERVTTEHDKQQNRLRTSMVVVTGGGRSLQASREQCRRARVEEALMKLRVAHAQRALACMEDTSSEQDKQRTMLEAAMNERLVEIAARRDMFCVQKRALFEECGKLKAEVRERENRIAQLKKRYEILMITFGKDEAGQQLSVSFFRIKFAAERAELRERGASLDAEIIRCEKDISALEATLRVMQAAHRHFMRHIAPLSDDTPEIQELKQLSEQYYLDRDTLKGIASQLAVLEQRVNDLNERLELLTDKRKQLQTREAEAENEAETARERLVRNNSRLENARDKARLYARRAKTLVENDDDWRLFQMALWIRDYSEAAYNALRALMEMCEGAPDVTKRFAALVATTDIQRHLSKHQRRLQMFIQRIVNESASAEEIETEKDDTEKKEALINALDENGKNWDKIATSVNQPIEVCKKGYEELEKEIKTIENKRKIVMMKTGGGPGPSDEDDYNPVNKLKKLIEPQIDGMYTIYDGDADLMALYQKSIPEEERVDPIEAHNISILSNIDATAKTEPSESEKIIPKSATDEIRIVNRTDILRKKKDLALMNESSMFSASRSSGSGVSLASGYTKRLCAFRKTLAGKISDPNILEDIREQARRSTLSVRVVTLGLGDNCVSMPNYSATSTPSAAHRKSDHR